MEGVDKRARVDLARYLGGKIEADFAFLSTIGIHQGYLVR